VDEAVMPGAKDNQLVFTWKHLAALRDRANVVHVEVTQALPGQTGERAASAGEETRAQLPPGLGVVELRHRRSLVLRVAN
jgi:hypothetical protein